MGSDESDRFSARENFQIRAVEIGQDRTWMTRLALQDAAKAVALRLEVQPVKRAEESGGIESLRLSEFFRTFSNFPAQGTGRIAFKRSSVRVG